MNKKGKHMRSRLAMAMVMMAAWCGAPVAGWSAPATEVSNVSLEGEIQGENIVFTLRLDVDAAEADTELPLVIGDTGYLDSTLPRGAELLRTKDQLRVRLPKSTGWFGSGKQSVILRFAARPAKDGDWRQAIFAIPEAGVRRVSVLCDRNDLDVSFPGALNVERQAVPALAGTAGERTRVSGFLGIADRFTVRWKPEVRKLEAELVAACDASSIATASVGALRMDTVFTYRVIQGALSELTFKLPDINITQVHGEDIQDWRIDREQNLLRVTLSRPREDLYRLRVESEMAIPVFPCAFTLPVLAPERVLRTSGFLMIGTDSAIRFQVRKAAGLTQIDPGAFPAAVREVAIPRPARSVYAYQFANLPYALDLSADEIVTSFAADSRLTLSLADRMLSLHASVELDVKDAPLRELWIDTGTNAAWTVTGVTGNDVAASDTDIREKDGRRMIYIPFRKAVLGPSLVEIQMERALPSEAEGFSAPVFAVQGARAERGYLVVAAEKGLRLKTGEMKGLREVHTGSAPMRVADAQHAFRFRETGWEVAFSVERADSSVHAEVFHLVSLSEGVMYCSAAITYHVSAAPLNALRLKVPETIERIEFTGADIEGWTRDGEICTVRLQSRILGDYTLLVTYDRAFGGDQAELAVASIETLGTESEVGYVVLASSASLSIGEAQPLPASMFAIDISEVPPEYAALVSDPVIGAFKYTQSPHLAQLRVQRYAAEALLGQIADYVELDTQLTRDGEIVTTVNYFIKNATRQHLRVKLPPGANLWSIKQVNENGGKEDMLSQRDDDVVLVPVRRLRDPNTALQVEVVYALTHAAPGFWRTGVGRMTLAAPVIPDTHATFMRWGIAAPQGFSIAESSGTSGLRAAAAKAWSLAQALVNKERSVRDVLADGWGGGETTDIVRAVELATGNHLQVELEMVPAWMGAHSSARRLLAGVLTGLVVLVAGLRRTRTRRGWLALGGTLLIAGIAQAALGRSVLAVGALLVLVLLFLFGGGLRLVWRMIAAVGRRVVGVLAWMVNGWRSRRRAVRRRPAESTKAMETNSVLDDPFIPLTPAAEGDVGCQGRIVLPLLFVLGVLAAGLTGLATAAPAPAAQTAAQTAAVQAKVAAAPGLPAPLMDDLTITITGPAAVGSGNEPSAEVTLRFAFRTQGPAAMIVAPPQSVLKAYRVDAAAMDVAVVPEGYLLTVKHAGEHLAEFTLQTPVSELDGRRQLTLALPENLRNKVTLTLPESGLEVLSDEAVLFTVREKEKSTEAEAVFGAARMVTFNWRPRVRRTQLEKTEFFCEVNALAALQAGVVDVSHQIQCRIAQGEVREMKIRVPSGMTVTAVETPGVATWSFDPETRLLDAIFSRPVTGELTLHVRTQVACEGLPYTADIGALEVIDAARQRGSLSLAAADTIQVRVDTADGLSPMNIEDFSASAVTLAAVRNETGTVAPPALRRAFRYHDATKVSARVTAEPVMPEIRVEETGALTIADERIALSTRLRLDISKAGIFMVDFQMPTGFEVESLTGQDVSHWDEAGPVDAVAASNGWNRVTVHFNRPVLGATDINLVMARMERGIDPVMTIPRVKVTDARTHRGRLTLAGERGVRMMVEHQVGVDMKKASEVGIRQAGVLVFDIHRPDWTIVLRADTLDPVVKPRMLQVVELADGMMQVKAYIQYNIENAGVKTFMLQSPDPEATLTVAGTGIARVHLSDREKGIWQIDLHNKVENRYQLVASCQTRYQRVGQPIEIRPLLTIATEEARGYLAVTGAGRVQVSDAGSPEGLRSMDPRNIPADFGAGDLSAAVKCYEFFQPGFRLALSVVRHDAADVLAAGIEKTTITSVLAADGRQLMRVELRMNAGRLRLLKIALPKGGDPVWMALVNGQEAPVSRDGGLYCIPLDVEEGARDISVEFMYAGTPAQQDWRGQRRYEAPRFEGLPLRDIEWVMYVPEGFRYTAFGGSMEPVEGDLLASRFDIDSYLALNRARREETIEEAGRLLDQGAALLKEGKQREARDVLRTAMNYSQGEADLNEDARVQFRNLQMQQVKVGLYNRRGSLRNAQNIAPEENNAKETVQQLVVNTDGQFTPEYYSQVQQALSVRDRSALDVVAERMVGQQDAAKTTISAIRAAMPEHGLPLRFYRKLLIDPAETLDVEFSISRGGVGSVLNRLLPAVLLFGLLLLATRKKQCEMVR